MGHMDDLAAQLPSGWHVVVAGDSEALDTELVRECPEGHALYNRPAHARARCDGCDLVLYEADGGYWAAVHLTWAVENEMPRWPSVSYGGSLDEVLTEMADDHRHVRRASRIHASND